MESDTSRYWEDYETSKKALAGDLVNAVLYDCVQAIGGGASDVLEEIAKRFGAAIDD